jgi:hypothetical protein
MPIDYFVIFLILDFISFLIGLYLISHFTEFAIKKTKKKLGYGPIIAEELLWPSNYYSNWWFKIKPQYQNKVNKWMKEFKKNRNNFYFFLGLLLCFIGIILPFLIAYFFV